MKTITINKKQHQIRQVVINALFYIRNESAKTGRPYLLRGDFQTGAGRNRKNAISELGRKLEDASAGAIKITHSYSNDEALKRHPRAKAFVVKTSTKRFNLVIQKLEAAQKSHMPHIEQGENS